MAQENRNRLIGQPAPAHKSVLGSWQGETFQFASPAHERAWQQQAYRQSVHPDRWQGQAPVDAKTQAVLDGMEQCAVHALGIGDKATRGMNCFAYEGLVKRVIGGHWVWSPRMQQLAVENKIEAYILPGGVSSQLFREIGGARPGLITHVGLGTVCDPRHGGGRMNAAAKDDLAEVITLDGREYLRYKPYTVNVALVRASAADEDGNISFEHEAANLDAVSIALAARTSGGKVIVQDGLDVDRLCATIERETIGWLVSSVSARRACVQPRAASAARRPGRPAASEAGRPRPRFGEC